MIKHIKQVTSVLEISEHGHRKLHTPVDHHLGWVVIAVTVIVFTILIDGALAKMPTPDPVSVNQQSAPAMQAILR